MSASIQVRHVATPLSDETPRYWFGRDPFRTHFFNALSSTFPEGEAFFVRAVNHFKGLAESDEERARIRQFGQQEGLHARQHDTHVELMEAQGYRLLNDIRPAVDRQLRWLNQKAPKAALSQTAALEHLTAVLARQIMAYPERWVEPMHADMAKLWRWHAMEEAEHKAVAYDLYQRASGSYFGRCLSLVFATVGLFFDAWFRVAYCLHKDGLLFRPSVWWRGWRALSAPGPARKQLARDYRAWFRRDFHPSQIDDDALIAATERDLREEGFLAA